jgi:hypothetical protein
MTCPNKVIPDLLYYVEKYVKSSTANKYSIPFPATFDIESLVENKSFIRLLFDETWDSTSVTSYRFLYRQEDCLNTAAETTKRRMAVRYEQAYFFICDSDDPTVCNVNVFDIQQDDIDMLDLLLQYRIDSSSVSLISIVYDDLSTNLSKLIYHYLNFKINNEYALFDTTTPIASSDSVLENFYESFIVDIIFVSISGITEEPPVGPPFG